jgi:CspA family cold shock protein
MSTDAAATTFTVIDRLTGRVKWFNNKAGYGFITVTDGVRSGSDIFVHHSSINVSSQQYKYLVQGEYVELVIEKSKAGVHEYQAVSVSGIKGGKLMCETRNEFKMTKNSYKMNTTHFEDVNDSVITPKQYIPRIRGEGPKESESNEKKEWNVVGKTQNNSKPVVRRGRPPKQSNTISTI